MARLVIFTSLIISICVLAGCNKIDTGKGQIVPPQAGAPEGPAVDIAKSDEIDLAEKVAVTRQDYRRSLEVLVQHYNKKGNNMKLNWAQKELSSLNEMPQYNYVVEASIAGPNLKPNKSVSEADYLYNDAVRMEEQAGQFVLIKDDNLLRLALDKYNQLINKFPTSDKIDDAAYRAAGIYEHFKDYTIAVLYYQRTYQWNPNTPSPAMYKAAHILDQQLHRRAEALKLYKEALAKVTSAGEHPHWQQYAEQRVKELMGEATPPLTRE